MTKPAYDYHCLQGRRQHFWKDGKCLYCGKLYKLVRAEQLTNRQLLQASDNET